MKKIAAFLGLIIILSGCGSNKPDIHHNSTRQIAASEQIEKGTYTGEIIK